MTDAEQRAEQRVRDIERQIKKLNSKNPSDRRVAATFLGEAAAEDAVPKLVDLYQNDPDRRVREAAGYALGQFRAIEEAVAEGDDDIVVALLDQVENRYQLGQRANPAPAVRFALALLIALIALVAANLLIPAGTLRGQIPGLTEPGLSRLEIINGTLQPLATRITNDAATLQSAYQGVLTGNTLDCEAFFNDTSPIALAPENASAYPDLADLANQLNAQTAALTASKTRYDSACFGDQPLRPAEIGGLLSPMIEIETAMRTINSTLDQVAADAIPTATPLPSDTPAVTPTDLAPAGGTTEEAGSANPATAPAADTTSAPTDVPQTPTPAESPTPVDVTGYINDLFSIIDSVQRPRGASAQLLQYWRDAAQQGRTEGCQLPPPGIPSNYILPAEAAAASPQLAQAGQLVNSGLEGLRNGWRVFTNTCTSGNLRAESQGQLAQVTAYDQQFTSANQILRGLLGE